MIKSECNRNPLSSCEDFYLQLNEKGYSSAVSRCITLNPMFPISEEVSERIATNLKTAVHHVFWRTDPVYRSVITKQEGRSYFKPFELSKTFPDPNNIISIPRISLTIDFSIERLLQNLCSKDHFLDEEQPLWFLTLAEDGARYHLIITFHHALMDGTSCMELIQRIMNAMSDNLTPINVKELELLPWSMPPKCHQLLKEEDLESKVEKRNFWKMPLEVNDAVMEALLKDARSFDPIIVPFVFSQHETQSIIAKCKRMKVSVTSMLGAASLQAIRNLFAPKDALKIQFSVNMRRFLDTEIRNGLVGNYISSSEPAFYNSDLETTAQCIQEVFNQESLKYAINAATKDTIQKLPCLLLPEHQLNSMFMTNLGNVDQYFDERLYVDKGLEWIPEEAFAALRSYAPIMMIMTLRGVMKGTFNVRECHWNKDQAICYVHEFKRVLL